MHSHRNPLRSATASALALFTLSAPAAVTALTLLSPQSAARAATAEDLSRQSRDALDQLYRTHPGARSLARQARTILIFPNIVKAGLVFGGAYGEGEEIEGGRVAGYYNSVTGSWGLQAGAQSYGYALFLMTQSAVDALHDAHGWELGVGPTVVVVNSGVAENLSTNTLKDDAYAFIFDQKGLMAGVSIEGSKISHIHPPR
jgi:lipid-binding SYLF domain-containing protein